jgi:hypothetical protein
MDFECTNFSKSTIDIKPDQSKWMIVYNKISRGPTRFKKFIGLVEKAAIINSS